MQDATNSSNDYRVQSRSVRSGPLSGLNTSLRRLTAVDFTAAFLGAFTALGVLAVLLVAPSLGDTILEADRLEQLAFSTVTTTIGVVFASFFCGGWIHGSLRGRTLSHPDLDLASGHFDEFDGRSK